MAKTLIVDLGTCVVSATAEASSCRQTALRILMSLATAARWRALVRTQGGVKPKPQGGNQRSSIVDIHSDTIFRPGR